MSRASCLEEDLYGPVKLFLESQGFEVRSEVHHCDVTAVKDEQLVIVELKKHLSVDLLAQGVLRQKMGDLVYVAIPKPKKLVGTGKWKDICHLIRRLELGLLLISLPGQHRGAGTHGQVEIAVQPETFDREKSRRASVVKKDKLLIEHRNRKIDLNRGGSKGKKLVTAYRELAIGIACCLKWCGPLNAKMIGERGIESPKITSVLRSDYYSWFQKLGGGFFALSEQGRLELELYPELVEHYTNDLKSTGAQMDVVSLDVSKVDVAKAILELQHRSYSKEAELIDFKEIPQLYESLQELQTSNELFVGCYAAPHHLVAFTSYKIGGGTLDVHRLCVDPDYFRRGLGRTLLDSLIKTSKKSQLKGPKKHQIHRITVTAAEKNRPALQLYQGMGFTPKKCYKITDELTMIELVCDGSCVTHNEMTL